jgi:hypothetical protein
MVSDLHGSSNEVKEEPKVKEENRKRNKKSERRNGESKNEARK